MYKTHPTQCQCSMRSCCRRAASLPTLPAPRPLADFPPAPPPEKPTQTPTPTQGPPRGSPQAPPWLPPDSDPGSLRSCRKASPSTRELRTPAHTTSAAGMHVPCAAVVVCVPCIAYAHFQVIGENSSRSDQTENYFSYKTINGSCSMCTQTGGRGSWREWKLPLRMRMCVRYA